jgi:hypothetical protein
MKLDAGKDSHITESEHMKQLTGPAERIPMHPDDFNAHLAWITAKRFQEMDHAKTAETPVYYGIIG